MKLFTIGSSEKSAEDFFSLLRNNKVKSVIDIRLINDNIYAGFTRKKHLPYLLETIIGIPYIEMKQCAPTKKLLFDEKMTWPDYKKEYLKLIKERNVIDDFTKKALDRACLLCAEPEPNHCHRKILSEYLAKNFTGITIEHL